MSTSSSDSHLLQPGRSADAMDGGEGLTMAVIKAPSTGSATSRARVWCKLRCDSISSNPQLVSRTWPVAVSQGNGKALVKGA